MKKIWSIFLSILLGAFVVGIGTGYFLYLANKDRQALAMQTELAKQEAQKAYELSQQAIQEANQKVTQASSEVTKAQNALKALEFERDLLNKAKPINKPNTQLTKNWPTVVSASLGISMQYPPLGEVIKNDEFILALIDSRDSDKNLDQSWFTYQPYSSNLEQNFKNRMSSSTPVSYFINGKLLAGEKGVLHGSNEDNMTYGTLLNIYSYGTTTHILWIQNPPEQKKSWRSLPTISVEDILGTIDFQ
ncbi:hypothetical protein KKG46_00380 [Patescibacteria group bacterium]|nr:hypothetical protein [Patescibacteria group bacterium]